MGFTVVSHSNDTLRYALFSDTHKWQCFKTESCSLKDNQIRSPCGTLSLSWPEWFLLRVTLHPCFTTVSIKMFEISPPLERAYFFGIGTLSREFSSLSVGFKFQHQISQAATEGMKFPCHKANKFQSTEINWSESLVLFLWLGVVQSHGKEWVGSTPESQRPRLRSGFLIVVAIGRCVQRFFADLISWDNFPLSFVGLSEHGLPCFFFLVNHVFFCHVSCLFWYAVYQAFRLP